MCGWKFEYARSNKYICSTEGTLIQDFLANASEYLENLEEIESEIHGQCLHGNCHYNSSFLEDLMSC